MSVSIPIYLSININIYTFGLPQQNYVLVRKLTDISPRADSPSRTTVPARASLLTVGLGLTRYC